MFNLNEKFDEKNPKFFILAVLIVIVGFFIAAQFILPKGFYGSTNILGGLRMYY